MKSLDVIGTNIDKIAQLFPNCVTEHLGIVQILLVKGMVLIKFLQVLKLLKSNKLLRSKGLIIKKNGICCLLVIK